MGCSARSNTLSRSACLALLLVITPGVHSGAVLAQTAQANPPSPQDPTPAPEGADKQGDAGERFIGRLRLWVDDHEQQIGQVVERSGTRGVYPLIGLIVGGSGLSAGVEYRDLQPGASPIGFDATAMVSYRGYQLYRLQVGFLGRRDGTEELRPADAKPSSLFNDHANKRPGVAAYADLRYLRYPQAVFYGVGPDSARVDRSNYLLFGASFDAVLQWQITKVFGICGRAGLLAPGLGAGRDADHPDVRTVFDASTAPGLIAVPRFVTTGIAAVADARDHASDPHRGVFFGTALWWFDGISQHEFNFARATADLRGYHTPGSPRGVLAWRALLSADLPSHGAEVPFYLEQTLGGGETLRGFQAYRFRDRAIMAASIEYRWRMNDYLDLGPFVDAGAVAPRVAALALRNLETSAGVRVGLRYKGRVLLHLDWGMCREGQRVTVGVGTMF